jgi:hypothetical protein
MARAGDSKGAKELHHKVYEALKLKLGPTDHDTVMAWRAYTKLADRLRARTRPTSTL